MSHFLVSHLIDFLFIQKAPNRNKIQKIKPNSNNNKLNDGNAMTNLRQNRFICIESYNQNHVYEMISV